MAQQICQESDVIKLCKKIFRVEMSEGMGIDRVRVDVVASGKALQLTVDPARGDLFSLLILRR